MKTFRSEYSSADYSAPPNNGQTTTTGGSSAELGRRAMGGVGAMVTREREEEYVRFMAFPMTSAWRNSHERWTSVYQEITRDHVKKNFLASGKEFVGGC